MQKTSGFRTFSRQKQSEKKYPHTNHEHDADETHQAVVSEKQVVE
jgi:hypothetical protein